jgi:hypothetical protein
LPLLCTTHALGGDSAIVPPDPGCLRGGWGLLGGSGDPTLSVATLSVVTPVYAERARKLTPPADVRASCTLVLSSKIMARTCQFPGTLVLFCRARALAQARSIRDDVFPQNDMSTTVGETHARNAIDRRSFERLYVIIVARGEDASLPLVGRVMASPGVGV